MWKKLRQPLSAAQSLAVVVLVLVTGSAVYGLYCGAAALWHRHMLKGSIPEVLAGVRQQRESLIAVIESYKGQFGYYPPMFTKTGAGRGTINPLCYELLGVQFNPHREEFRIPVSKDTLKTKEAQAFFNARSFSNCLVSPNVPTNFMAGHVLAVSMMTSAADLYGVGVTYPDFTPEAFWEDYEFSPWRYATNPAEHNPGKFDLWVEINVAGQHFTIGNWPQVK
ncbi:MAG TPA: hypothetical protein VL793_04175 [Patescibacteria group bacterium]|nr:hypothetical protein [Patescibacteria group bacterium]